MTDRKQVIDTLTELLNHWKRLLSEGICTKDEGERIIDALTFAIESIKVDRAYDLAYEKVDFIEIPEGATNGDIMKILFPKFKDKIDGITIAEKRINSWWNSPYRK